MGTFKNIYNEAEKLGKEIEDATGAKTLPEKIGAAAGMVVGAGGGALWNVATSLRKFATKGPKAANENLSKVGEDIEEASVLVGKVTKEFPMVVTSVVGAVALDIVKKAMKNDQEKAKEQNKSTGQDNSTKRLKS